MRNLALMPETGIHCRLFAQWLSMENLDPVNALLEMGLIQEISHDQIALHPMIREVCESEFRPSICSCQGLIEVLYEICLTQGVEITYHKWLFQGIEGIMQYAEVDDASMYFMFLEGAFWCMEKYQYEIGMKKILKSMKDLIRDPVVGTKKNQALLLQCRVSLESDPDLKRKHLEKAISLIPDLEEDTAGLMANLYNNLGISFLKEKDYKTARKYIEQGVRIMEKFGLTETKNAAMRYINYADVLVADGEPQRGFEILRALKNRFEKENRTACDDYGTVLYHLGVVLTRAGHFDSAKEHLRKALEINAYVFSAAPEALNENRILIEEALRKLDERKKRISS